MALFSIHIKYFALILFLLFSVYLQANKENKRTPPPVSPITKSLDITTTPLVKKEKRQSSSRYNVSKNCELTPLPPLNESK